MARGNLTWPQKQRHGWVVSSGDNHRIYIHAVLGFLFVDHAESSTVELAVEARMTKGRLCNCQLIALWERKRLSWQRGIVMIDEDAVVLTGVLGGDTESAEKLSVMGTPVDMLFLCQILHALDKSLLIRWQRLLDKSGRERRFRSPS